MMQARLLPASATGTCVKKKRRANSSRSQPQAGARAVRIGQPTMQSVARPNVNVVLVG